MLNVISKPIIDISLFSRSKNNNITEINLETSFADDVFYNRNVVYRQYPIEYFNPLSLSSYYWYQSDLGEIISRWFFASKEDVNLITWKVERILSILSLLHDKKFNIENEESIEELFETLEIERLNILEKFIEKVANKTIDYNDLSKINIYITPSSGDIDDFNLDFVFNGDTDFGDIDDFVYENAKLKRNTDEEGLLWFVNMGVEFQNAF